MPAAAGDRHPTPAPPMRPRAGLMSGDPALLHWPALRQWLRNQPDEERHFLEAWLQSPPAALQHEPSWEGCLQVWITAQGKASQTLLQQPLAEGRDETTIQAGLTLLRWLNQQCQQVPEAGVRAALGDA